MAELEYEGFNEYNLPLLQKGNIIVEWVYLNEGYSGEFDPSDLDDDQLLRFDISKREGGFINPIDDASYCTHIRLQTPVHILQKALRVIMSYVWSRAESGESIKKLCEWLSWINEKELI